MLHSRRAHIRATKFAVAAAVALLVALVLLSGPAPAPAASSSADGTAALSKKSKKRVIGGLFNKRYCEILAVSAPTEAGFPVVIYNTIGLNNCPTATWDSLDFGAIAADRGLFAAVANGPRRWLIDSVTGGAPGPVTDFGGLEMREVATLTATSLAPESFAIFKIGRDNNWIFRKGRKIRELIAPNGRRFVMQAYTNTVDPGLNLKTLDQTGSNPAAAIPEGWKFKTRRLKRKLVVRAGGEATIVRDGLRSVYQKYKLPRKKPKKRR
jgi:hypothetical protein